MNRYIVDGNFLKEQLENDIVVSESACDATLAYNEAVQAYLTALAQTLQGAYPAEVKAEESGLLDDSHLPWAQLIRPGALETPEGAP